MRYIKLFEELSRIVVTPEEKASIKKITNRYISLLKDTKSDINIKYEKFTIRINDSCVDSVFLTN